MNWNELERKGSQSILGYYTTVCLVRMRKTMEKSRLVTGTDSNTGLPEYKAETLNSNVKYRGLTLLPMDK